MTPRKSRSDSFSVVFDVLDAYEAEANAKAANAERRNKPLMRGYWLAVAIHVRHLRRRIRRAAGVAA